MYGSRSVGEGSMNSMNSSGSVMGDGFHLRRRSITRDKNAVDALASSTFPPSSSARTCSTSSNYSDNGRRSERDSFIEARNNGSEYGVEGGEGMGVIINDPLFLWDDD